MIITHSPEETRALGKKIAAQLKAGDTVLLTGDMGAGKSELARGIARGLGVAGPVPSPSFTILNAYDEGRIPLYHFDWYRVQDSAEIGEMGMDEQIGGDGIALIEWSENAPDMITERNEILKSYDAFALYRRDYTYGGAHAEIEYAPEDGVILYQCASLNIIAGGPMLSYGVPEQTMSTDFTEHL